MTCRKMPGKPMPVQPSRARRPISEDSCIRRRRQSSPHSPDKPAGVRIRLKDLLSSLRRHLRAAAKAQGTIELYSYNFRNVSRWLSDRGWEPVLEEPTRHVVAAWLAET